MQDTPPLITIGQIVRRLDEPLHRIEYVIQTRHIKAVGKAGNVRVFSNTAVERISSELQRMDAEKGGQDDA